jgi:hypothetical protein
MKIEIEVTALVRKAAVPRKPVAKAKTAPKKKAAKAKRKK